MHRIILWGVQREIASGELPLGTAVVEAATLAALTSQLETPGSALVLCDGSALDAEREGLKAWLKAVKGFSSLLVAIAEPAQADALLAQCPFLDDVWLTPLTPPRVRLRIERALDTLHSRRVIAQLDLALARKSQELSDLNKIGVALSAESDIDRLLKLILAKSCEISAADAGSLYLVERGQGGEADRLRFKLTQNESVAIPFEEFTMPLDTSSIAGYAAAKGRVVSVPDVYDLAPDTPYAGSGGAARSFDEKLGYRTKSMLVVPMKNHRDKVVGVIQLINKKRDAGVVLRPLTLVDETVVPFTAIDEELVKSLTSQAAVAFEKTRLVQDVQNLFDSFVRASVTAIEQRDPTTSGHSARVATLTQSLAEAVDRDSSGRFGGLRFTREQMQQIRYASLLHDFGKVGVREKVLIKGKKLYSGELLVIRNRFAYIKRTQEAEHLRAKLDVALLGRAGADQFAQLDRAFEERQRELDAIFKAILESNEPSFQEERTFLTLMGLPARLFTDIDGRSQPMLTPDECAALQISRGTLSERERREIESHVTHTFRFLSEIPWTEELRDIPEIAYAHHEKLDGSGYPRRLTAAEIPIQAKMMTVSDIFDALVAWDRPYKRSMAVEGALRILNDEAGQGKLDTDLVRLFVAAKIYERSPPPGARRT